MNEKLLETLRRKALGYTSSEQVTEYDAEGNEIKQKITTKDIQPDMTALKMLLDIESGESISEAELEAERDKLIEELKELYKDKNKRSKNHGNQEMQV